MIASGGAVVAFLVTIAMVYDVISATNSSPQTTEINAKARADTLMKWVHIGLGQAVLFIVIAVVIAWYTKEAWWAVLAGGTIGIVALYVQYVHAKNAGMKSSEPGTETYAYGN